jgi:hypothetical protein
MRARTLKLFIALLFLLLMMLTGLLIAVLSINNINAPPKVQAAESGPKSSSQGGYSTKPTTEPPVDNSIPRQVPKDIEFVSVSRGAWTPGPPSQETGSTKERTYTWVHEVSQEIVGDWPDSVLQYSDLVLKYCPPKHIDVNLCLAIMLQESGGQTGIISKDGAVGVMQVMPRDGVASTFMCTQSNGSEIPCFWNRPTTEELKDDDTNVNVATDIYYDYRDLTNDAREARQLYGPLYKDPALKYYYSDLVYGICRRIAGTICE